MLPAILVGLAFSPAPASESWDASEGGTRTCSERAGIASEDRLDPDRCWLRAQVERLREIQGRHEEAILALNGVLGMGIGAADGSVRPVFVVFVDEAAAIPPVPLEIEGVEVRLERRAPVSLLNGAPACATPCHASQLPPPVEMGNSGGWENAQFVCTLGFKACDLGTGKLVFVTNSHCNVFPSCSLPHLGTLDWQHPGRADDPGGSAYTIGQIAGHAAPSCGSSNNFTDATKVESSNELTSFAIRDTGFQLAAPGDPLPGDAVQKSGRTTGLTSGVITAVNCTVQVPAQGGYCCGALAMKDQVEWLPQAPAQGGDSGSALLTLEAEPRLVGLNWGENGTHVYANHIDRVLSALNLSLTLVSCIRDCPFARAVASSPDGAGLIELGHRFREQVLRRTAVGRELVQTFNQFSAEAVGIAVRSPRLLQSTRRLLLRFRPVIRDLVERGQSRVRPADLRRVERLLAEYEAEASPAMKEAVGRARRQLHDPEVQRALGVLVQLEETNGNQHRGGDRR
jgi:hypothetical protein